MSDKEEKQPEVKDEVKLEVKDEVKPEVKDEIKPEVKDEVEPEELPKITLKSSIFITEDDVFDISVRCHNDDKGRVLVEGQDEEFDPENEAIDEIKMVFKYPSQGDSELILRTKKIFDPSEDTDLRSFMALEFARIIILIRDWNLEEEVNRDNIFSLSTKIVKSVTEAVREELGTEAII